MNFQNTLSESTQTQTTLCSRALFIWNARWGHILAIDWRTVVARDWGWQKGHDSWGNWAHCGGDKSVLYLAYGSSYGAACLSKVKFKFKIGKFYLYKLFFNKNWFKVYLGEQFLSFNGYILNGCILWLLDLKVLLAETEIFS